MKIRMTKDWCAEINGNPQVGDILQVTDVILDDDGWVCLWNGEEIAVFEYEAEVVEDGEGN